MFLESSGKEVTRKRTRFEKGTQEPTLGLTALGMENFPVSLAEKFNGKEKPMFGLEDVAHGELWILVCHFGKARSLNKINILDASKNTLIIMDGTLLP